MKRYTKGFTLIELLATIAIIAILASTVLSAVGLSRAKARDAKRLSGISAIQKALELYYDAFQTYPVSTPVGYSGPDAALQMLSVVGYLKSDPSASGITYQYYGGVGNSSPYTECIAGACRGYSLSTVMEREENAVLGRDADAQVVNGTVIFEGDSPDCGMTVTAPDICFDVTALQIQQ